MLPEIRVREWRFSSDTCPALKGKLEAFTTETGNDIGAFYLHYPYVEVSSRVGTAEANVELPADDVAHPVALWVTESLRDLKSCAIRSEPDSSFRLRGPLGITPSEWKKIKEAINSELSQDGAFDISENLRMNLDGDHEADLVDIYQIYADRDRDMEDWEASWIGMFAGSGVNPATLRLTGPSTTSVYEFAAVRSRMLTLMGDETERWPIDSPDQKF